jgi:hypothetical protein
VVKLLLLKELELDEISLELDKVSLLLDRISLELDNSSLLLELATTLELSEPELLELGRARLLLEGSPPPPLEESSEQEYANARASARNAAWKKVLRFIITPLVKKQVMANP